MSHSVQEEGLDTRRLKDLAEQYGTTVEVLQAGKARDNKESYYDLLRAQGKIGRGSSSHQR